MDPAQLNNPAAVSTAMWIFLCGCLLSACAFFASGWMRGLSKRIESSGDVIDKHSVKIAQTEVKIVGIDGKLDDIKVEIRDVKHLLLEKKS